jgi:putative DNA primase/helicase
MSTEKPGSGGSTPGGEVRDPDESTALEDYVDDPDFDGTADDVRQYYRRVRSVYDAFSEFAGCPTTAWIGNAGVYADLEYLCDEDGKAAVRRRAKTIERDLDSVIEDIECTPNDSWRTVYNHTSWKDRDAVYHGIVVNDKSQLTTGDGLTGYGDMRGLPLWVDLDLKDNDDGESGPNYKRRRGNLPDDVRKTVERTYHAYTEEFADLVGIDPKDVATFDSGGGGYLYTPAAVTLLIAERYEGGTDDFGDARRIIFRELYERFYAYATGAAVSKDAGNYGFEGIQTRINERIDGASEYLDPDWMQNKNRQSKAPLSIHADHDVVVTPARSVGSPREIEYKPTLVSSVDEELISHTKTEVEKIVTVPDRDVLESWTDEFVSTLFHDFYTGDWRETLDALLSEKQAQKIEALHQRAREERRQRERLKARIDDGDSDSDSFDDGRRTAGELLTEIDVTPVRKDILDVLDGATKNGAEFETAAEVREWWRNDDDELIVDIRDVIREFAIDEPDDWKTSDRGHEITFDPCWRGSGSGESCAVKWVSNDEDDPSDPSIENGFIDNGCDGSGDPAKAYALGTGILPTVTDPNEPDSKSAAAESLNGRHWADAVEGLREAGYPIPVYVPEVGSEDSDGETYEKTPLWGLRKAAIALDVCARDDFVEHETDGGETYLGFDQHTYNAVLRALDDEGIDHGREMIETDARSPYYEVDLRTFVDDGDPWCDPDVCLRACLKARAADAVSEYSKPPSLALLPLRRDMLNQPASDDMSDGTRSMLEDLFHEISIDELDELLG